MSNDQFDFVYLLSEWSTESCRHRPDWLGGFDWMKGNRDWFTREVTRHARRRPQPFTLKQSDFLLYAALQKQMLPHYLRNSTCWTYCYYKCVAYIRLFAAMQHKFYAPIRDRKNNESLRPQENTTRSGSYLYLNSPKRDGNS